MFDLLKKKLSSFTDKLKKKTEEKPTIPLPEQEPLPPQKPLPVEKSLPAQEPISQPTEPQIQQQPVQQVRVQPDPVPVPEPEPVRVQQAPVPEPGPVPKPDTKIPPMQKHWPGEEEKKEAEKQAKPDVSDLLRSSIGSVRDELVKEHELEKAKKSVQPAPEKPVEKPPVDMQKVELVKAEVASPVPVTKPKSEPKPVPKKPGEFKLKSFSDFLGGKPREQTQVIEEKPLSLEEQEAGLKKLSEQLNAIKSEENKKKTLPITEPISREELLKERVKPVVEEDKRELKSKVGVFGLLKGAIKGHIELKESDISELLFELELSLLEADVNQETAKALIAKIKEHLLTEKIPRGEAIDAFLKDKIKQSLTELTHTEKINILEEINAKKEKPFRILFLGPNGAGKTTTIAKLSFALRSLGKSVIWAASDTFRAASIEQLEEHAKKLNIRVVKHSYGADPTAVAFDAVKAAQASHIEVVIIDSAGRQETNRNLIEELKKLERVIKPDLKIFVGETYSGKGLIDTAKAFDKAIGIDAFILTKIDTDPKGGTVISLLYELKKPVLFIGTGQRYEDLVPFTPSFIIDRII